MLKLVIFVIVLSFVLDKALYYTVTKISDNVYSGQAIGKLNHYLAVKDTTKMIVFGSSRANHHIDVKQLEPSSFNMGVDGKFIAYSATMIKMLPTDKSQVVMLHVDPNVAFREYYSREDMRSLMVKYHTNDIIRSELQKAELNNALQEFYWSMDYNGLVLGILKNAIFPKYDLKNYYGFDPIEVNTTQKDIFEKILAKNDTILCKTDLKVNPLFVNYLEEIHAFCKTNKKRLITITTPIYIDKCPDDNRALRSIMNDMGIEYHDYTHLFDEANSLDYWMDIAHMTHEGAKTFIMLAGVKETVDHG